MTVTMEQGSINRSVDDPVKLLLAGMLKNASDDIDRFIEHSDKDYFANTKQSQKYTREYLVPVVCLLEWLSSADDSAATLVTFNNACEMLGLDPEASQDLFLKKIRGISNAGRATIHRYITGILSDDKLLRKHHRLVWGQGKDSDC